MAKNEIFAPNGPHNKMSLPVTQNDVDGERVLPGVPVMVAGIVGVAQTALETVDGEYTGVVNSNAPGNVTVWNEGTWRLPVILTGQAAEQGALVYAEEIIGSSVVKLYSAPDSHRYPFGVFYEADAATTGTKDLGVRVFQYAGDEIPS